MSQIFTWEVPEPLDLLPSFPIIGSARFRKAQVYRSISLNMQTACGKVFWQRNRILYLLFAAETLFLASPNQSFAQDHFSRQNKMAINLKYIDPTYMIWAIPSNASDNVYCTLLAQSTVHGAMAGYTGFTVGPVNGRHSYIPFQRITEKQNNVVITDRMWVKLLSSTNQPSFLTLRDVMEQGPTEMVEDHR